MHLALHFKQYVVFKISPNSQPTHLQAPPLDVGLVAIDLHMVIISVYVGKNLMEDVLLHGGSSVNIITKDLRKKLGLPIMKPKPYTLKMVDETLTKPVGLIVHGYEMSRLHMIGVITS